jgi:hypothetical protein
MLRCSGLSSGPPIGLRYRPCRRSEVAAMAEREELRRLRVSHFCHTLANPLHISASASQPSQCCVCSRPLLMQRGISTVRPAALSVALSKGCTVRSMQPLTACQRAVPHGVSARPPPSHASSSLLGSVSTPSISTAHAARTVSIATQPLPPPRYPQAHSLLLLTLPCSTCPSVAGDTRTIPRNHQTFARSTAQQHTRSTRPLHCSRHIYRIPSFSFHPQLS